MMKNAYFTCNSKAINSNSSFARNSIKDNDNIQLRCKLVGGMKEEHIEALIAEKICELDQFFVGEH